MNLFAVRKHLDRLLKPFVSKVSKLPIHANQWTLLGAFVGLACAITFLYGYWWAGLGLLLARGMIDNIDGYVARNRNQRSTFGAVMDDITDRWVLGIIYAGACLYLSRDYPHVLIVLGFGITGSLCNVIAKLSIYAESQQDVVRTEFTPDGLGVERDPAKVHVFVCGNPDMIGLPDESGDEPVYPETTGVVELLTARGFKLDKRRDPGNIHFEEFW